MPICLRISVVVGLLMSLAATVGCETTPTRTEANDAMLAHYEAGRYQHAYDTAVPRTTRGSAAERDVARYVAGVSAYQLGRDSEAVRHLEPLTNNRDRGLAGRANATLGLVHVRRGQNEQAITAFRRSVRQLSGEDLAHAYYHMALAEQRLGRWTQARTSLSHAMNHSQDAGFRREVQQRITTTGFTLQLGAFQNRSNADELARQMRTAAARARLGSPRVVPSTGPSGGRLYLVQVGNFGSFDSAVDARRRMGRTDVLITVMR